MLSEYVFNASSFGQLLNTATLVKTIDLNKISMLYY